MISQGTQVFYLPEDCQPAIERVEQLLSGFEMRIVRSFDLRTARAIQSGCTCPHHGTTDCNCQLVILLVYLAGFQPATLVAHSRDGHTWLSLVSPPDQPVENKLVFMIQQALRQANQVPLNQQGIETSTGEIHE